MGTTVAKLEMRPLMLLANNTYGFSTHAQLPYSLYILSRREERISQLSKLIMVSFNWV